MTQLSLFDAGPQCLLDDASGRIVDFPDCVAPAVARDWFERLHREITWKSGRRLMYEREVDVPRLRAHFSPDDPVLPPPLDKPW